MKDLTLPTPALPKLPVSWATSEGMRHTPAGTHEFWGYVYGDQSIAAGADLYTAEQMQDYARAALSSNQAATDKESLTVAPVALGGEPPCNPHPDAPHGYNRNASHNAGRYVCDCEGWAALGGEKGEAVAHGSGSPLDGLADKYGTRWGAPDEMGWSFEQHAFQDFCAEFADAIRTHKGTQ